MRVVIAPDSFGGTLSAAAAAEAIARGWRRGRPDDDLVILPMSDGGEGLLDVVRREHDEIVTCEVAGPLGTPVRASYLFRHGDTAIIETALACGLALVAPAQRNPARATTFGVGQLIVDALNRGARNLMIGLGGSATVEGGAGALVAMGHAVTTTQGSGIKVGADELCDVVGIEARWTPDLTGVETVLLADVATTLRDAATVFGPQKGADPATVEFLTTGLDCWGTIVDRDLAHGNALSRQSSTGAAGGLGYALIAAMQARVASGASAVADLVGLDAALVDAALVVTGEGRLDATSTEGKVVGVVAEKAHAVRARVVAVCGQIAAGEDLLDDVEAAAPGGPGPDPAAEVAQASERLASRIIA